MSEPVRKPHNADSRQSVARSPFYGRTRRFGGKRNPHNPQLFVLSEAREKKQILVFDAADSFLLSRRQASHSWEVTEVNEMLTWMERHPYPFICTTNFDEKLDEAAFRRFTFKVRFDYLNRQQVRLAFRQFFGTEAPPEALRMTMLSPSDFAVVRKKCSFLEGAGGLELTEMLRQETAVKSGRTVQRSIGFLARSS